MATNIITGIKKVYYAVLTEGTGTYSTPKVLCEDGAIDFEVKISENSTGLDSGNNKVATEFGLGEIEVSTTITSLATADYAAVYGLQMATGGGVIYNANRVANRPYIALLIEKTLNSGAMEYTTLYKGKLGLPGSKAVTQKEGKVEFQTLPLSGTFMPVPTGEYMHTVRSTDTDFVQATFDTKWKAAPVLPIVKP